jgi:MFS family permease
MSLLSNAGANGPTPVEVDRAVRLTYVQMMLTAIFGASTGGMFLIGFALDLGATDFFLGLMASIPMFFVVFQLLAAWFIERGLSPKRLTVWFGFITPLCWLFIAALPFFAAVLSLPQRLAVLVAVLAMVTIASQFSGNARAVWVGDLIPAERRGAFFGACALFSGIVGAIFAVGEGRFLDFIRTKGLLAFTSLFLFGAIFGLIAAALNIPQVEGKRLPPESPPSLPGWVRTTCKNRPLLILAGVHAIFALGSIVGPFMSAYCLRDLKMSFFGVGCVNAVGTVSTLIFAPMWGKAVDRYGGRPVLNFSLWALAPCGLIWFFIPPGRGDLAYRWMPWVNFFAGFAVSALNVAIASLMYKMTPSKGRSFQFAFYNIFVMLIAAPMPLLGGWLVSTLQSRGWAIDLRVTFYLWIVFMFGAAICARWVREPDSSSTQRIVFEYLPEQFVMVPGFIWSSLTAGLSFFKIRVPVLKPPSDPPEHSKDST